MTSERFSNYRFELSASQLPDSGKWMPYVEIKDCSENPDDGAVIFPMQSLAEEDLFDSEEAAIAEARRFAISHVSSGEF